MNEHTCSEMALCNYFKRVDDDSLPDLFGPLSLKVLLKTIAETNKQVKEVLGMRVLGDWVWSRIMPVPHPGKSILYLKY